MYQSVVQLLENENEFIIHGYAYRDWIREIPNPHINVGQVAPIGGVDLNRAMSVVYNETRDFLIWNFNVTEDSVSALLQYALLQLCGLLVYIYMLLRLYCSSFETACVCMDTML